MHRRPVPDSQRKPWSQTHAMHKGARPDAGDAFLEDPGEGPARAPDELAEMIAEEYVASALAGEEVAFADRDETAPEEYGGPYTEETIPPELVERTGKTRAERTARPPAESTGEPTAVSRRGSSAAPR